MKGNDDQEPSFEAALAQLERIVSDLERGNPELSEALTKYEQGVKLLARCHRLLDSAEQSVALLTGVDAEGNPQTAPFDATATAERERPAPAKAKRASRSTASADVQADDPPF